MARVNLIIVMSYLRALSYRVHSGVHTPATCFRIECHFRQFIWIEHRPVMRKTWIGNIAVQMSAIVDAHSRHPCYCSSLEWACLKISTEASRTTAHSRSGSARARCYLFHALYVSFPFRSMINYALLFSDPQIFHSLGAVISHCSSLSTQSNLIISSSPKTTLNAVDTILTLG